MHARGILDAFVFIRGQTISGTVNNDLLITPEDRASFLLLDKEPYSAQVTASLSLIPRDCLHSARIGLKQNPVLVLVIPMHPSRAPWSTVRIRIETSDEACPIALHNRNNRCVCCVVAGRWHPSNVLWAPDSIDLDRMSNSVSFHVQSWVMNVVVIVPIKFC